VSRRIEGEECQIIEDLKISSVPEKNTKFFFVKTEQKMLWSVLPIFAA